MYNYLSYLQHFSYVVTPVMHGGHLLTGLPCGSGRWQSMTDPLTDFSQIYTPEIWDRYTPEIWHRYLKMAYLKGVHLFQTIILGFHVGFLGVYQEWWVGKCISFQTLGYFGYWCQISGAGVQFFLKSEYHLWYQQVCIYMCIYCIWYYLMIKQRIKYLIRAFQIDDTLK